MKQRQAFTLIELMVSIAIIFLLVSVSTIAIAALFKSSEKSQAIHVLRSSLTKARSIAMLQGVTAALRIERSFKADERGVMLKKADNSPWWLNRQQIRIVVRGSKRSDDFKGDTLIRTPFGFIPEQHGFRKIANESVIELPRSWWLAPHEALTDLDALNVEWQPSNANAVSINPFETFYIAFSHRGELKEKVKWLYYLDETQHSSGVPAVDHPTNTTTSVIAYNREEFEQSNNPLWVLQQGLNQYISKNGDIP